MSGHSDDQDRRPEPLPANFISKAIPSEGPTQPHLQFPLALKNGFVTLIRGRKESAIARAYLCHRACVECQVPSEARKHPGKAMYLDFTNEYCTFRPDKLIQTVKSVKMSIHDGPEEVVSFLINRRDSKGLKSMGKRLPETEQIHLQHPREHVMRIHLLLSVTAFIIEHLEEFVWPKNKPLALAGLVVRGNYWSSFLGLGNYSRKKIERGRMV